MENFFKGFEDRAEELKKDKDEEARQDEPGFCHPENGITSEIAHA